MAANDRKRAMHNGQYWVLKNGRKVWKEKDDS